MFFNELESITYVFLFLIGKLKNKNKSDLQITFIIYANNLTWHGIKDNEKSGSNAQIPSVFSPHQRRINFFEPGAKRFKEINC
ncbi:hypothetical protein BpHYR1_019536 [Brachionus plicatilis]|uniref:Uncharacterized protein n=1 Tax=Brachionus plicatilis TaxID=10195 RepID=A0A3M7RIX0_BRAPC|nr:hypothetical protein BpHYR1_019536 [Brachionus plicatilis]